MKRSLIFIDNNNYKSSIGLLEVVRQMFGHEEYETYGICINFDHQHMNQVFDKLITVDENLFEKSPLVVTSIIEEIHNLYKFDSIIIPATAFGRMLAPRLAMRLKVGLVADVTAIDHKEDVLEMIRPAFSGKIMAAIVKIGVGPIMMSVRPDVFVFDEVLKDTEIIYYTPDIKVKSSIKLLKEETKTESYDIRDSDVLISGGGGIIKDFWKLNELAEVLNGQVSASRMIIDKGIAPRAIQVGQSGKTVTPKLYIALGINGAIQHVEGLKNVESIISVNINRNAPICSLSDIVVEGDANIFIEQLIKKILIEKNK